MLARLFKSPDRQKISRAFLTLAKFTGDDPSAAYQECIRVCGKDYAYAALVIAYPRKMDMPFGLRKPVWVSSEFPLEHNQWIVFTEINRVLEDRFILLDRFYPQATMELTKLLGADLTRDEIRSAMLTFLRNSEFGWLVSVNGT